MNKNLTIQKMTATAFLIALGLVIPMFSPVKIILPPASFTLASHVPIMLGMLISPVVAGVVALGTTLGFLLGGFPIVIVMRAATHVVFCLLGAVYLRRRTQILASGSSTQLFSLCIGLIHGLCETLIVMPFFFGGGMNTGYYDSGFFVSVILLVGVGSAIHSMIDFAIALVIYNVLIRQVSLGRIFLTVSNARNE